MAKHILKDISIRTAKAEAKDKRLNDGEGLYLLVKPNGAKWWRFDFSIDSKRKTLSVGVYPAVSLSDARARAAEARATVAAGNDPSQSRKDSKEAKQLARLNEERQSEGLPILNSFADVTRQWLGSIEHLTSTKTHTKKTSRIERLAFPLLGNKPVTEIKSSDVLEVLKPMIGKHQLETAHRLHAEISSVFAYAIVHNFTDYDPAQPVAKQIPAQKVQHRAAM